MGQPERRVGLLVRQGRGGRARALVRVGRRGFSAGIRCRTPGARSCRGSPDEADVAWYARTVQVPGVAGKRVFLVVGASDWKTSGWLDGQPIGSHQGGYTPFELELTRLARPGGTSGWCCAWTTRRTPSSWRASRGTGRRAACGRPSTWRRGPRVYVDSFEFHRASREAGRAARAAQRPGAGGRRSRAAGAHGTRGRSVVRRGAPGPGRRRSGGRVTLPLGAGPRCGGSRIPTSTTRRSRSARRPARTA